MSSRDESEKQANEQMCQPIELCHRTNEGNHRTGPEEKSNSPMGGQTLAPDPQVLFLSDTRSSTPDDVITR